MSEESAKAAGLAAIDRIKTRPKMAKRVFKAEAEPVEVTGKVRSNGKVAEMAAAE